MSLEALGSAALALVVLLPLATLIALSVVGWFGVALRERVVASVTNVSFGMAAVFGAMAVAIEWSRGTGPFVVHVGQWYSVGHYRFEVALLGDSLGLAFAVFASSLLALIAVFSRRYLHREPGFFRFYFLLTLFGFGVNLVVLSNSLAVLFFGWEFVGITSALLIAFFHERRAPVRNGLRTFVVYRICDVGLLAAVVAMEVELHGTSMVEGAHWGVLPDGGATPMGLLIGCLIVFATIGKSAQLPFGNWLPRAMEGPTPSSAIFYGAISIHLGPFLLLRSMEMLERDPGLSAVVIAIGALTALHGSFVGRVQTDIKSAIAFASMTQVGLIFVEIGAHCPRLALVHIIGHSAVRTLEILRSPNLIHDYFHLEQAVGPTRRSPPVHIEKLFPAGTRSWWYRLALDRGGLHPLLQRCFIDPFLFAASLLERADRTVTGLIERSLTKEDPGA